MTIEASVKASSGTTFRVIVGKASPVFPFQGFSLRIANDNHVEFTVTDCGTGACGFSLPGGGGSRDNRCARSRWSQMTAPIMWLGFAGPMVRVKSTLMASWRVVALNRSGTPIIQKRWGSGRLQPIGFDHQPVLGLIDEVTIYNRALTAEEIAALFRAGSAGKCRDADANQLP